MANNDYQNGTGRKTMTVSEYNAANPNAQWGADTKVAFSYGGKTYALNDQQYDWIKSRYKDSWADSYGYDVEDQQAKAAGRMSSSVYNSYKNNGIDYQLRELGLPSVKNLEKYMGAYDKWHTGGISDYFGKDVPQDFYTKTKEMFKGDWQYDDTQEDQLRKSSGQMPSKLASKYTDTEIDDELRAAGLPPVAEMGKYIGRYNNYSAIDNLYRNAAWRQTALQFKPDDNGNLIKNDNNRYTVDGLTMTGKDWYAKAFYDELGKEDNGNKVYASIIPLLKKSTYETTGEDYIDPTNSYVEEMDKLFSAYGKAEALSDEYANYEAFSYDDFVKKYDDYYNGFKDVALPDGQTISQLMAIKDREESEALTKEYYDVRDDWFDKDVGIYSFIEKYRRDYPTATPEQMFNDMLQNGVDGKIVRKTARKLRYEYADKNEGAWGWYEIKDGLAKALEANKDKDSVRRANINKYIKYESDEAEEEKQDKKKIYNEREESVKAYIKDMTKEYESDTTTVETALARIKSMLVDEDEGTATVSDVDSVIEILNAIEKETWNNPVAMRIALEDFGFSPYGNFSGPMDDITANWSDDDKMKLAISIGSTRMMENEDKRGDFDKKFGEILGDWAVTGNTLTGGGYKKLDHEEFEIALDWAMEQAESGAMPYGEALNVLAGMGFQDELKAYMGKEWQEAHFKDVTVPAMFEQAGGAQLAMWEEMTPEQRAQLAQSIYDDTDKDADWDWKSDPTVYRTFGQALEQQFAAVIPSFALDLISGGIKIADAVSAGITGRPEMWGDGRGLETQNWMKAQEYAASYGSVYDNTNGAKIASIAADATSEIARMYLLGSVGGAIGEAFAGTAVGGKIASVAAGNTPVIKKAAGMFLKLVSTTPFIASAFAHNYSEYKSLGVSNGWAAFYGMVTGLAEGVLEGFEFDNLWGKVIGQDTFAKKVLDAGSNLYKRAGAVLQARIASAAVSGLGEATEEGLGYVLDTYIKTKHSDTWGRGTEWSWDDALDQMIMGGLVGLIGGGLASGDITAQKLVKDYLLSNDEALRQYYPDLATAKGIWNELPDSVKSVYRNGGTAILSRSAYDNVNDQINDCDNGIAGAQDRYAKAEAAAKAKLDESLKVIDGYRGKAQGVNVRSYKQIGEFVNLVHDKLGISIPERGTMTYAQWFKAIADTTASTLEARRAEAQNVYDTTVANAKTLMNNEIEQANARKKNLQNQLEAHWAGIYLLNTEGVANFSPDVVRDNMAQAYQNGATVEPRNATEQAAENAEADPANIPWFGKKSRIEKSNAEARPFTDDDAKSVIDVAAKLKYKGNVSFVDEPDQNWNGRISLLNGDIVINKARLTAYDIDQLQNNPAMWILEHELNHYMKSRGSKYYDDFHNAVVSMLKDSPYINGDEAKYNQVLDNFIDSRQSRGLGTLTREQAEEELVGNFAMEYLFASEDAVKALFRTNGTVGERILSWIRYKIDSAKLRRSKEAWASAILDLERMYARAYRETRNKPQSKESLAEQSQTTDGIAYSTRDDYEDDYEEKIEIPYSSSATNYDYSRSAEQQYDDFKSRLIPKNQPTIVGGAHGALSEIGLSRLPLMLNSVHMWYATEPDAYASRHPNTAEEDKYDHFFTKENYGKLDEAIADPVAIIANNGNNKHRNDSVIVLTDVRSGLDGNGKLAIVPIALNAKQTVDGVDVEGYSVNSVHGRNSYWKLLSDALFEEGDGHRYPAVYYVNKEKVEKLLADADISRERKAQISQLLSKKMYKAPAENAGMDSIRPEPAPAGAVIHSIAQSRLDVNTKSQIDTNQFKKWFGRSMTRQDGVPLALYRTAKGNFTNDESLSDGTGRYYVPAEKLYTGSVKALLDKFIFADRAIQYLKDNGYDGIYKRNSDGHFSIKVFNRGLEKSADDTNVGLFSKNNGNPKYSADEDSMDFLGGYKGVANPATGVTVEDDERYMEAALAGDEETAREMVRDMYERNMYTHGYRGDRRPGGSYDYIDLEELDENGYERFKNQQAFISEEDPFPANAYVGDSAQDMEVRPLSYGPAEVDMLNEYVADMNDTFHTDYELDTWFTDKDGNRLTQEEVDKLSADEVVPHYGLYHTEDEDAGYEWDERTPAMLARRLMMKLDKPNSVDGSSIVNNPLAGGVLELYVKGDRVNETRGYNQSWNQIPFEGEIPDEYRYDSITLSRDEETGKRNLTAVKSDGTVIEERNIPAGPYEMFNAFNKVFGKGQDVYAEFFGWNKGDREFTGIAQMNDDGSWVAKDVAVNPETHKVYNRTTAGRITDEIGISDRENGYDLSRITNIYDGAEYPSNVLIARNQNLIKSADPIMYDAKGEIVPLHKRGNEMINTLFSGDDDTLDALGELDDEVINPRNGVTRREEEEYDELVPMYQRYALDGEDAKKLRDLVKTVAKRNGFTETVFHGTNSFGFTAPDVLMSDDSISFFASRSPHVARTYIDDSLKGAGEGLGIHKISDRDSFVLSNYRENELRKMLRLFADELYKYAPDDVRDGLDTWIDMMVDHARKQLAAGKTSWEMATSLAEHLRGEAFDYITDGGKVDEFSDDFISMTSENAFDELFNMNKLDPEEMDVAWDWVNIGFDQSGLSDEWIEKAIQRTGTNDRRGLVDYLTDQITIDTDVPAATSAMDTLLYSTYVVDEETGEVLNDDEEYEKELTEHVDSLVSEVQGFLDWFNKQRNGVTAGQYRLYANTDGMYVVGDPNNTQSWHSIKVPDDVAKQMRDMGLRPSDGRYGTRFKTRSIAKWAKANNYTGVIYQNIWDGGGQSNYYDDVPADTIYNFFSPETQLRSSDVIVKDDRGNIIPLSERFDPASGKDDFRWSGAMDESLDSLRGQASLNSLINQYGAQPQGREPRASDIRVPNRTQPDNRVSRFGRSVMESPHMTNDMRERGARMMASQDWLGYIPKTNEESMEEARNYIAQRQPLQAQQEFHDMVMQGKFGRKTNAIGLQLLADASNRGDVDSFFSIATDLQIAATEAGQSAQIFNVLKELKGVGSAYYMQRVIDRLNTKYDDLIQKGKMERITVPQELMENLSKATTVDEIANAEEAVAKVIADQLPLTWDDRMSNWRYFSMLANPTTHVHNMFGNLLMKGLNTAKDAVATGIETVGGVSADQRGHAILTSADKAKWQAFADESYKEQARNLSGGGKLGFETFVEQNKRSFDTKWLNALAKLNFKLLEGEDIMFIRPAYKNALMQYMKAQGYTLNDKGVAGKFDKKGKFVEMSNAQKTAAVEWASQQAWKQTFRDASSLATLLNKLSKENAVSRLLVEGVMPFKKTPINIAKRGLEYSPAGIIMGTTQLLTKVKQGKMTAAQAIDNLASGITGTALMALGVALAKAGLIRAGGEDKKKYETYLEDTGDQTYAMKFGDYSVNMSAIAPATIPLFMGVALNEMIEQSGDTVDLSTITDTIAGTLNPFMEMSFMASLNSALKNYNSNGIGGALGGTLLTAAQNYGSQYLPTLGGKIAQFADPTLRSTKSSATSPIGGNMDYYARSLAKKIPGLEATLEPDVNVWGQTTKKDTFSEWAWDFANKFILPTNVKVANRDAVDNELIRVVESTGNVDFLPSDGNKYFTVKGKKYSMNARQYAQYSQERGQAAYAALKDVMSSPAYVNASDEAKADMLNKAKEAAYKAVNNIWKDKLGAYNN